jgi:hypothetical protein
LPTSVSVKGKKKEKPRHIIIKLLITRVKKNLKSGQKKKGILYEKRRKDMNYSRLLVRIHASQKTMQRYVESTDRENTCEN